MRQPRIGVIRTCESTRTLARRVEAGTARIRSATLSWQRGRWHVSFSVELPDLEPSDREPAPHADGRVVGVDLGLTRLATLSTGERESSCAVSPFPLGDVLGGGRARRPVGEAPG